MSTGSRAVSDKTVRLRQRQAKRNGRLGLICLLATLYTFAGFGVFWLRTGSWTIGVGGTFTPLGDLVWMSPQFTVVAIVFVGDRGPFRAFYQPRATLEIDANGLVRWAPTSGRRQLDWGEIGGISSLGVGVGALTFVYDREGREVLSIDGEFRDERSRRRRNLPALVIAEKPGLFEAADPRHPERGCVRREVALSGEPRSAP